MKNELHLIDCMEFMKGCKDGEFDLAITDPPYGIGDFEMKTSGGIVKGKCEAMPVEWNCSIPDEMYFRELKRISKKQFIWGANYYNCFSKNGGAYIWYKNIGHKSLSQCEIASVSWKKNVGYYAFKKLTGFVATEKYIHPCQKPVELYKDILKNYAKPGDKILDTHSGSGSLRIACYDLGFDLVSCELDPDYYRDNEKRFQNHIKQKELFAFVGGEICE